MLTGCLAILLGFLSGSVMYAYLLPKQCKGIDIRSASVDGNPGTANVFTCAGARLGILCVLLELLKGFIPVYLARKILHNDSYLFSWILVAPVLGHAFSPMLHFHGGKAIAVSFGSLLGLLPESGIVWIPALLFILLVLLKVHPHELCTVIVFSLFSVAVFFLPEPSSIRFGTLLISITVIFKNLPDAFPGNARQQSSKRLQEKA